MKKVLIAIAAVVIVVWGLWIAFPATAIQTIIEDSVHHQNITLSVEGLKKGLFYRLHADRIVLKSTKAELVSLLSIHGTINPLSFIALRMDMTLNGGLGTGNFFGNASVSRNTITAHLDFMQAQLKDIQLLNIAGIRGTGALSGKFTLTDQRGHLEFLVKDAEIQPAVFAGVTAPLNLFDTVKGSVDIEGNTFDLVSVTLEGRHVFARLRGVIKDNIMDLRMELMPQKLLLENPLFFSQIDRYQVSPGYYLIPVKSDLAF